MKKLMMLTLVLAVSGAAQAMRDPAEIYRATWGMTNGVEKIEYIKTVTADEWRACAEDVLAVAATNAAAAMNRLMRGSSPSLSAVMFGMDCPAANSLASEYDAKFAAAGLGLDLCYNAPKMFEVWLADHAAFAERFPVLIATVRKNGRLKNASFAEYVNCVAEMCAGGSLYDNRSVNGYRQVVLEKAPPAIRRALRGRGMSFVVSSDGANPVQAVVDELVAALNAPKFKGLGSWVGKWFPSHTWVEPKWMGESELKELMDKVFYGDVGFGVVEKIVLESHLGVDAYNDFVRRYNGEE